MKVGGGGVSLPLLLRASPESVAGRLSAALSATAAPGVFAQGPSASSSIQEPAVVLSVDLDADAVTKMLAAEGPSALFQTGDAISEHLGKLSRVVSPSLSSPSKQQQHSLPKDKREECALGDGSSENRDVVGCRKETRSPPQPTLVEPSSFREETDSRNKRRGRRLGSEGKQVSRTTNAEGQPDVSQAPYAVLNLFGAPQLRGRNREPRVVLTTPDPRLTAHGVALSNRLIRRGIPVRTLSLLGHCL